MTASPAEQPAAQPEGRGEPEPAARRTRYGIKDRTGTLIAYHVRYDKPDGSKSYSWQTPDRKSGLDRPAADLPLYGAHRLPDLQVGDQVVVVEGEKAAHALVDAGLNAVGTVTGASSSPSPAALADLAKMRVILWPDADPVGRAHMARIAAGLDGLAESVRWVEWVDAPDHADAADADAAKIAQLVETAGAVPAIDVPQATTRPRTIPPITPAELEEALSDSALPRVRLERLGPSYSATVDTAALVLTFRDLRLDGSLPCDLEVRYRGRHLWRSPVTLTLTGRNSIAKTIVDLGHETDLAEIRPAVFAAVEAVLTAEESLGGLVDLRSTSLDSGGSTWATYPITPNGGPSLVVAPAESGKSTIARAKAYSVAAGESVIPGLRVDLAGPVLYIAAEDPVAFWHGRSLEAIARGVGRRREDLPYPITLLDTRGRPLHRIARSVAERATDHALVILDSLTALLPSLDSSGGGVRERDSLFWTAIDSIARPTMIIAHPNREDGKRWGKSGDADGRVAGSDVNRDRTRIAWRVAWRDEPAVTGTSYRRYTVSCTKFNHGPRPQPISFAASWEFGLGGDVGILRFLPSDPLPSGQPAEQPALTKTDAETLAAYEGGCTTPTPLAAQLGIPVNTAKMRLHRLRERGLIPAADVPE